jgi:DNA/RNA endonuclease G (NUC1)
MIPPPRPCGSPAKLAPAGHRDSGLASVRPRHGKLKIGSWVTFRARAAAKGALGPAAILVLIWAATVHAWPVEYCSGARVSRQTLARYDTSVWLFSRQELIDAERAHLPWGWPEPACPLRLFAPSFIVCYDTERRVPLWSAYRLRREDVDRRGTRRPSFRTDPRVRPEHTATCDDYKKHWELVARGNPRPNYLARGHSVPDSDVRLNKRGQAHSYYLSNIAPQWQRFNGGIWAALEARVRAWARRYGAVYVITGPVFDKDGDGRPDRPDQADRMPPDQRVAVPTHFFKIVLRGTPDGGVEALTVLLPHWRDGRSPGPLKSAETVLQEGLMIWHERCPSRWLSGPGNWR